MTKKTRRPKQKHARKIEARSKAIQTNVAKILQRKVSKLIPVVVREIRDTGIVLTGPPKRPRSNVKKQLTRDEIEELIAFMTPDERALVKLVTHYGLIQVASAGRRYSGASFLITPAFEAAYLGKNIVMVQQLSRGIEKTFRAGVGNALSEWTKETPALTIRDITNRIRTHHFIPQSQWTDKEKGLLKPLNDSTSEFGLANRARTIARTETARAINEGHFEGMKQAGFTHHEWSSYQDAFARPGHAEMDGQIRRLGEPFTNETTGESIMIPGDYSATPEETINCRCEALPVIVDL